MRLTCPACGAIASAEAWANDIEARTALAATANLPEPVSKRLLAYLALFRPAERALSWRKTVTLITDLDALVSCGYVRVKGSPDRPCTPEIWALAMGQMVDSWAVISRPLPNHNYLRKVAWQLADRIDADLEAIRNQEERSGQARADRQIERQIKRQEDVTLTEAERKTLQKLGLDKAIEQMRASINK